MQTQNHIFDSLYYLSADEFFQKTLPIGLTFDDVSLATAYSEILPKETDLAVALAPNLLLQTPIISADMDTVTEARMAIGMALNGGLGLIHCNMTEAEQLEEVTHVKNYINGCIQDPITVSPESKIGDILEMIEENGYGFRTFPVVEKQKLVGLLSGHVVRNRYANMKVADAMTKREDVFTILDTEMHPSPVVAADKFFTKHLGIHKLLVVDKNDQLRGLFTLSDIERIREESAGIKPARDSSFRLVCGASISTTRKANGDIDSERILSHIASLVERGIDAVTVSTAHGHSKGVGDPVQMIRNEFKDLTIIAGNVTSGEGVEYLAKMGANVIKVGQGPGSICTTRIVAGVGIPQLTATYVASRAAKKCGVKIVADGGITKSGDMVKALTLADAVMCGGLFAGCREAPGEILEINGKFYKQYRGMGSLSAMKAGSAARYGHDIKDNHRKLTAEGVEAMKEVSDPLEVVIRQLVGGIQSGMGYHGAKNLEELRSKARYIQVTTAGQRESSPHDVIQVNKQ